MKLKLKELFTSKNIIKVFLLINVLAYIGYASGVGHSYENFNKPFLAGMHLLCFTIVLIYFIKNRNTL